MVCDSVGIATLVAPVAAAALVNEASVELVRPAALVAATDVDIPAPVAAPLDAGALVCNCACTVTNKA